jgi:hypothetical protein
MDCGQLEGLSLTERVERWGTDWQDMELGIEKTADVSSRGALFLDEIYTLYRDKKYLLSVTVH